MKGCLKSLPATRSVTPTSEHPHPPLSARKCVAFQAQACLETIFTADDWDRTPTEPSRKLSYQELLELKEIQRSLPIADQPPDPLSGRAGRRYLSGVPIALAPLLPESDSSASQQPPTSPVQTSPNPTSPWMAFSPNSRQSSLVPTPPHIRGAQPLVHQSHLSHLPPSQQQAPKPKPRFAFLPLLDSPTGAPTPGFNTSRSRTPSPARSDPPTPSLTNTSLDSSPMSQASTSSSCSEPPFFQLPPPKKRFTGYCQDEGSESFPHSLTSAMQSMKVQPPQTIGTVPKPPFPFEPNHPTWFGRSNPAFKPAYAVSTPPPAPSKPEKKRNVIVVNGIEIDLDGDDTPAPAPKPKKKRNVMVINGIEMDLGSDDEDEEDKPSTPQPRSPVSSPKSPSSPSSITSNGLPTPPPSTSPSPTLSQRTPLPPTDESPFSGLHAPIRFKRAAPPTAPQPSSPPKNQLLPSSPSQRRGSFCGAQSTRPQLRDPRSSPILVPRA